ncbi:MULTISPECIES: hypothetical protein [Nocardiaceae]|uniref:Uncharacterized protein n=1 Tax=Rhodococcoides corynebacterioides TaxID=53972 RepID=A0ABS2KN55_9NOCA|nr:MULTISPECIES: hypothetical protein [Rhodococcus]MBM7413404.1 hypothetical protein [Rhodococcus corynebacterioides]MBP1115867.1 hypothetical protein [Rhodococcus sp. PvP016]
MADDSDVAQARVFLAALDDEIATVSVQLEDARRLAAEARARGNAPTGMWHEQQAATHKRTLRELHRQTQNLRTRFALA